MDHSRVARSRMLGGDEVHEEARRVQRGERGGVQAAPKQAVHAEVVGLAQRRWLPLETVIREIKRAQTEDTQLGSDEVFSVMPPSEGLNTLNSCAMSQEKVQCGDTSRAHKYGKSRWSVSTRHCQKVTNSRERWHDWNEACMERKTRVRSGVARGPRNWRNHMEEACPPMSSGISESEGT